MDEHLAVCPEAEQDCPFKQYGCPVKVWNAFVFLPLRSLVYGEFILLFDSIQEAEGHSLLRTLRLAVELVRVHPEKQNQ